MFSIDHHQVRKLMHSDHAIIPLGNPKSCTEELFGSSICSWDSIYICTLSISVPSSPITVGLLCPSGAAPASGTRRSRIAVFHPDRAHPVPIHPSPWCLTLLPPLNFNRPPHPSAFFFHASGAPASPRHRSSSFLLQNVWYPGSTSVVRRCPPLVTRFLTISVSVVRRRAPLRVWCPSLLRLSSLLHKCIPPKGASPSSKAPSFPSHQASLMADNQGQPSTQGANRDPLGNLFNSKECSMCMAHTIMINSVKKQLRELADDYHADRESKRKKLGKRKKEIEALKDRCIHMEAVIDHLRTLTESQQAEAPTRASAQKDDSVTAHFP